MTDHRNPSRPLSPGPEPGETVLSAHDIVKRFPGTTALDGVGLELRAGEVHALLGENGAGKSTLIKILGGFFKPTTGRLEMDGETVVFESPADSQRRGVRVIAQEFDLVPTMTVEENIFLGHELWSKRRMGLDRRRMRSAARSILEELGVEVPPHARIEQLSVADQQLVEIAKALSVDFRVLVLDEPTAALSVPDIDRLFAVIRRLRARGVAMLYVSHRLKEVAAVAQRVSVLRDGRYVGGGRAENLGDAALTELIVGQAVELLSGGPQPTESTGTTALELHQLNLAGVFEGVDLQLRYGEVLGITGLAGSGRAELSEALVGLHPALRGRVSVDGKNVRIKSPTQALAIGIASLPEDRKSDGIVKDLNVRENLVLGRERTVTRLLWPQREQREFSAARTRLRIKTQSSEASISSLSGGNQQKVLIGRLLATNCRILVLNEPTRGVDVQAKSEIHALIRNLAGEGYAVLVSSSDIPELVAVSDRCAVLVSGRVSRRLTGAEIDEPTLVACSLADGQGAVRGR
jgi:ribose transport system ATP-binding protein